MHAVGNGLVIKKRDFNAGVYGLVAVLVLKKEVHQQEKHQLNH
jgi:hypothetical protein